MLANASAVKARLAFLVKLRYRTLVIPHNRLTTTNICSTACSAAISLWQKLGFAIVGTLPQAFSHKSLGYVDAYVMHRFLDDVQG